MYKGNKKALWKKYLENLDILSKQLQHRNSILEKADYFDRMEFSVNSPNVKRLKEKASQLINEMDQTAMKLKMYAEFIGMGNIDTVNLQLN